MVRSILVALALLALAPFASAADLVGTWSGTWTKAGDALPVVVTFTQSKGKLSGAFDSDALRVTGIPFKDVSEDHDKVRIVLSGDASTTIFEGTLRGDSLSGTLTEGDVHGTFDLKRTLAERPLARRKVSFDNGEVTLAGEIILPATLGRHPAILFLHGSGPEGRWASRFMAEKFARAGFVALIYDKRGVGASKGDWQKAGFEDLVGDALAGLRLLSVQSEVDPARVGIFGHSQGGSLAPIVAEHTNLAFVIASAASGLTPEETEIYSVGNSIGIANLPQDEQADAQAYVRELVAVAYEGRERSSLDEMATRFKDRSWFFAPPPADDPYYAFSRRIASYQPLEHWSRIKAPVLLIYGAEDERVPAQQSGEAISAALKAAGNNRVTLKIAPHADHTFTIVPTTPPGGWPKAVPDYIDTLIEWAKAPL